MAKYTPGRKVMNIELRDAVKLHCAWQKSGSGIGYESGKSDRVSVGLTQVGLAIFLTIFCFV